MSKSCGHTKPCGCADQALTTQLACEAYQCPTPEPCPETFRAQCVVYTGDNIPELGLQKGERLDLILQRLVLLITNPGCIDPTGACQAVLGLLSSNITSTTVDLTWVPAPNAVQYTVEYKLPADLVWTLSAPTTNPEAMLGGLLPDTEYQIRVNTDCGGGSCYSVTIQIKTQP